MLEPEKKLNKEQLIWLQVTSTLTFRELTVLMERYVLGYDLPQIAQQYDLELERIRQIENTALQKITLHSSLTKKSYACRKNARRKTGTVPSSTR